MLVHSSPFYSSTDGTTWVICKSSSLLKLLSQDFFFPFTFRFIKIEFPFSPALYTLASSSTQCPWLCGANWRKVQYLWLSDDWWHLFVVRLPLAMSCVWMVNIKFQQTWNIIFCVMSLFYWHPVPVAGWCQQPQLTHGPGPQPPPDPGRSHSSGQWPHSHWFDHRKTFSKTFFWCFYFVSNIISCVCLVWKLRDDSLELSSFESNPKVQSDLKSQIIQPPTTLVHHFSLKKTAQIFLVWS